MNKYRYYQDHVEYLKKYNLLRDYSVVNYNVKDLLLIEHNGKKVYTFCTNDYLCMSKHPEIIVSVIESAQEYGCGTGGSRYISGNSHSHDELESSLASLHDKESAVVFANGYMANLGLMSSIAKENDIIFSDAHNHASIIDGCKLSRASCKVWRHNDLDHLEFLLKHNQTTGSRIIVAESLYSMGGDYCPLVDLVEIAKRYSCLLSLDEIHAVGIYGNQGKGIANFYGLEHEVDFITSGLGKSFGVVGGYIATNMIFSQYLKSTSRPFIFTTSIPNIIVAAALKSIEIVRKSNHLRENIYSNSKYLSSALSKHNFDFQNSESHIFPIITGSSENTQFMSNELLKHGIYVQGIQYPTVPKNQGQLRVTLTPYHTEDMMKLLCTALVEARKAIELNETIKVRDNIC